MRKRISCKVVRSIPLSRSSDGLRYVHVSINDKPYNISDASIRTPSANAQVRHANNSFTYTGSLKITRVPIDDGLTAQILDYYA